MKIEKHINSLIKKDNLKLSRLRKCKNSQGENCKVLQVSNHVYFHFSFSENKIIISDCDY